MDLPGWIGAITAIVVATMAVVGAVYAHRRFNLATKRHATERERLSLDKDRATADGYSRAVAQLASRELAELIGGIHELGRLARDSDRHHWKIMEVLTAWLRSESPGEITDETPIREDFLAGAEMLRNRNHQSDRASLDLRGCDLRRANFASAVLGGANLVGARLEWAVLARADLSAADLSEANLTDTVLHDAVLRDAQLFGARLRRARMTGACLERTELADADMEGAILYWADLRGAQLSQAHLEEALLGASRYSRQTSWPRDFNPHSAGCTLIEDDD